MHLRKFIVPTLLAVIALCLIKVAFFPEPSNARSALSGSLVPSAFADGSIIEWKDAMRIVSTGDNGATTYVWDYEGKTKVRKYSIRDNKLVLETYSLDK